MGLGDLHHRVHTKEGEVSNYRTKNAQLRERIATLKAIHSDMKTGKRDLNILKNDLQNSANEYYPQWRGNRHKKDYSAFVQETLVNSRYTKVIGQVDQNMAAVNNKITEYENEILRNEGFVGNLLAEINSLWTRIQNWID